MNEREALQRARDEVARSSALFDRFATAWNSLLAPEQEALVEQAEALAAQNDEPTNTDALDVLARVVADAAATRADVAGAYAVAIDAHAHDFALMHGGEWARVNAAISERWGERALQSIKKAAWEAHERVGPKT